jgi:hypothetical protein
MISDDSLIAREATCCRPLKKQPHKVERHSSWPSLEALVADVIILLAAKAQQKPKTSAENAHEQQQ